MNDELKRLEEENRTLKAALWRVKETALARKTTIRMQHDSGLSLTMYCGIALAKCKPLENWNDGQAA
jgi:hypothetical protein